MTAITGQLDEPEPDPDEPEPEPEPDPDEPDPDEPDPLDVESEVPELLPLPELLSPEPLAEPADESLPELLEDPPDAGTDAVVDLLAPPEPRLSVL